MKNSRTYFFALAAASTLSLFACNGNSSSTTNATDTAAVISPAEPDTALVPPPAPVEVSADDSLNIKANDAIKDYPGVTASVTNGEVTLTGEISKAKLPKLLQAVNATHPKKVNNQLTIK